MQVAVEADGQIGQVGAEVGRPTLSLPSRALLPGMINAHSHAFQRGLRGQGERFAKHAGSFWSWRDQMYELVDRMDEPTIYELSVRAFAEMLAAGITTVGEFHYLHHDASGRGYGLDEVVARAAADTGIRLVLLNVYYATGDVGRPLEGAQKRFSTTSLGEFWAQQDRLATAIDPATQSLGAAAHSLRAVPIDEIAALFEEASRRGLPFHVHVEEQRREIEACLSAYGRRPLALLAERLALDARFTAIHCTHCEPADLEALLGAGGHVCICPLTEANLGDGIPDVGRILRHGGRICLGTDSNARICPSEEMRWLEYGQRLATESRGVCVDDDGHCARALWQMATVNGARALGVRAGRITAGAAADFVAIDLEAPSLAGWSQDTLLDAFVFGSGREAIAGTWVGGKRVRA